MSREKTKLLLAAIEEGLLDRDTVILACVNYLSEDDVADMCYANDLLSDDDDADADDNGDDDDENLTED